MKNKLQFLSAIAIVALSNAAFASPVNTPADCPSANMVASHANFTEAVQIANIWGLFDIDPYQFQGEDWMTGFVADLPGVTTNEEALEQGKKMFSGIELNAPEVYEQACVYAMSQDPMYVVAAFQANNEGPNYKMKALKFVRR